VIVRETTMTSVSSAAIDALGFVEVRGLAAAIETADAMLKSADVRLLRQLLRDPALTTITVEGSLGACSAAVDAGRAAAQRMDGFVAATVMGRPADDTAEFVLRLAEAGRAPFATPAPAQPAPAATPLAKPLTEPATGMAVIPDATRAEAAPAPASDDLAAAAPMPSDDALLAALVGLPGGYSAQSLARRLGGTSSALRERLEALCADGRLEKRGNRYRLATASGNKQ
jgi:ethanolamine utilization protein EutK